MFNYLVRKIKNAFFTLFGVVSIIFFIFNILPGDPARMMLDQNANSHQLAVVKKKFGFDLPLYKQYLFYLNDLSIVSIHSTSEKDYHFYTQEKYSGFPILQTNSFLIVLKPPYLRESFQKNGKKVADILAQTIPSTLVLVVLAIAYAFIVGVFLGVISALNKNTWLDKFIALFSTLSISIPSFLSAILFSWIFGFWLHEYTHLNMSGSLYEVDDLGNGRYISFKNAILPSIVLGIRPLAVVVQLMRNSLLDVLNQDYIRTAKAKGLNNFEIIKNHALKNALNPLVTTLSGWFSSMLTGAVFVEFIFGWNGLGKELVDALNNLDLPVLMGAVLFVSTTFVFLTIVVDIIYAYLDPRIKLE